MATGARRGAVIAAVLSLAVIISVTVVGLSVGGSPAHPSGGSAPVPDPVATVSPPSTPPTTAPSRADVAAARACQAFSVYLEDARRGRIPAAAGRALIEDASVLLRGSRGDAAAHRSLPRWATLGSDLLAAAEDVVSDRSEALQSDGAAAGVQCRTVPAAAALAGGFARS